MRVRGGRCPPNPGGIMQPLPEPSDADLRGIEMEELDAELAKALDAKRSHIPLKAKRRDAPAGIQKLDSLYKDPANWTPWSNVTLVYRPNAVSAATRGVHELDTILGFF